MAKRKVHNGVKEIYPKIFWLRCEECKQEFCREKGYKYTYSYIGAGIITQRYICGTCVSTTDEAYKLFTDRLKIFQSGHHHRQIKDYIIMIEVIRSVNIKKKLKNDYNKTGIKI